MGMKKIQKSLKKWTEQEWTTGSGKPSLETGEAYRPKSVIQKLKRLGKLAKANRQKRRALKKGKQFASYSKDVNLKNIKKVG